MEGEGRGKGGGGARGRERGEEDILEEMYLKTYHIEECGRQNNSTQGGLHSNP